MCPPEYVCKNVRLLNQKSEHQNKYSYMRYFFVFSPSSLVSLQVEGKLYMHSTSTRKITEKWIGICWGWGGRGETDSNLKHQDFWHLIYTLGQKTLKVISEIFWRIFEVWTKFSPYCIIKDVNHQQFRGCENC